MAWTKCPPWSTRGDGQLGAPIGGLGWLLPEGIREGCLEEGTLELVLEG